ncbi:MAG: hypothetical protein IJ583_14135 [Firmicutes bacterium]|nr:hypothetical protein [Bacillota bacterium]
MKKNSIKAIGILAIVSMALTACSGAGTNTNTGDKAAVQEDKAAEETEAASENIENKDGENKDNEEVKENEINAPIESALELYAPVISTLDKTQFYGFADIAEENPLLLVSSDTYKDENDKVVSSDATIYGADENKNVTELGKIKGGGTSYPIATSHGIIFYGGKDFISKAVLDKENNAIATRETASVTYGEGGKEIYHYVALDENIDEDVADDSKIRMLMDEYEKAIKIEFTQVG